MEILNLHLTNLRNEEHYKYQFDFSELVKKYSAAALGIEPLHTAYLNVFAVEASSLDVVRGSALTGDIAGADSERDTCYSGLAGTVKSALNHFNADVRAAAARLQKLFDVYGDVPDKPYDQETAAINKLVDDLQGGYAADAATVGISPWAVELKRLNAAFDTLKNTRYAENAAKPQENLKLARSQTDKAYKAIVKRVNALIEVNGEAAHSSFVTELNQRIANYNNVLLQRQGRNAKNDDDTSTDDTTNQ